MKRISLLAAIAITLTSATAFAQEYKIGDIEILAPHTRPTPAKAPVSGGYLTIRNTGGEDDRLIGGSASFAGKVEIHEMKMDGEVMRMRQIEEGLLIPAGGEITLKPGGLHIMFMQLQEQMKEGDSHEATLEFEKAGTIEVEFSVDTIGRNSSE